MPNEKVGAAAAVAYISVEVSPKVNEAPACFGTEQLLNWKVGAAAASGAAFVAATGAMLFVAPPNWKVATAVPAAGSAALAAVEGAAASAPTNTEDAAGVDLLPKEKAGPLVAVWLDENVVASSLEPKDNVVAALAVG